jgi:hypothetical protein
MEIREPAPSSDEGVGRAKAIARRRVIFALVARVLPWLRFVRLKYIVSSTYAQLIRAAMFIAGALWMLLIPMANMGRGTYIDENALQPGQVSTTPALLFTPKTESKT